ncbi:MAG: hybrid sensor histidine kinase/response regulator [Candidatus Marinarcus sp.]|uniref:hybrid sensor histidine kinase/response regulator n=1 Tax=Candidatus Marinarcus sp. TaxID=3100987 RepID=UPI003B00BA4C
MDKKYTVLIVDDQPQNLHYLNNILLDTYEVRATPDGNLALSVMENEIPDLILLDIKMPTIDGYEVASKIKKTEAFKEIPIIFISALDDVDCKVKAFEKGGVDYITKPFEPAEVLVRVQTQLELAQNRKTISTLLEQQDLFLKKIMHEINTPVSVIGLSVENLERTIGPKDELETIKASSKILSCIYKDLSYMIKKELPIYDKKAIDLLMFLSKRVNFFHEIALVKGINLELLCNEEVTLFMNETELERVVDNTISNAIKYSFENSIITLCIDKIANRHCLQIIDTGVGLDDTSKVFDFYYQASSKNLGLGLGLATVKDICKKYDIDIEVQSVKSQGTTFTYCLDNVIH